jgi:hypothetical protein
MRFIIRNTPAGQKSFDQNESAGKPDAVHTLRERSKNVLFIRGVSVKTTL